MIDGVFVFLNEKINNSNKIVVNNKEYNLSVKKNKIIGFDNKKLKKEILILDTSIKKPKNYTWIFLIIGFFLIIGIIFLIKYFLRAQLKKKKELNKKNILIKIKKSSTRKDYEELYKKKNEIKKVFTKTNELTHFFSIIDKFQYKKNWKDEELNEMHEIKEKIKG